jgi:O-antigen/teichoic acid export membrane protein
MTASAPAEVGPRTMYGLLARAKRVFLLPKGFLRNLKWQATSTLVQSVFGGLYQLLLGRFFGVTDFGVYSLATSFASLCFLCLDFRTHEIIVHHVCPSAQNFSPEVAVQIWRDISILDVVTRLFASLVAAALTHWYAVRVVGDVQQVGIIYICIATVFLSKLLNSPAVGILRVLDEFRTIAFFSSLEWALKLLTLVLAVVTFRPNLAQILLISLLLSGISNLFQVTIAIRCWKKRFPGSFKALVQRKRTSMSLNWKYAFSNLGLSVADLPVKELDVALCGVFLPLDAVGCYKMAKQLAALIWKTLDPMLLVLMPEFRKAFEAKDSAALRSFVRKLAVLLLCGAILGTVSACVIMFFAGTHLLGPEFKRVSLIFPFISAWIVVAAPLLWVYPFISALGRSDISFRGNLAGNLVGILIFSVLTSTFGLYGAALGFSLALSLNFILTAFFASRVPAVREALSL